MDDLINLAELLRERNNLDVRISALIDRPATTGHLGEFIASKIFEITLMTSASHKGIDGRFVDGSLKGCSVNIKFYPNHDGLLSFLPNELPDYFLVLAGPRINAGSSRGKVRPCVIESVYLFDSSKLVAELKTNRIKLGIATSLRQHMWKQAEIYPSQRNDALTLTGKQREMLALFGTQNCSPS